MTTTLTPFERIAAHREKVAFEAKAISALMDLIEQAKEPELQVEHYKKLIHSGSHEERMEEAGITAEAIKDLQAINSAIALICQNLNIEA